MLLLRRSGVDHELEAVNVVDAWLEEAHVGRDLAALLRLERAHILLCRAAPHVLPLTGTVVVLSPAVNA